MANGAMTSELKNTWEMAAPGWAKWERVISEGFSHATDRLIEMANVEPGMRVLDIACGAGSQTIEAAKRVGPEGLVLASDISSTMLEHVRTNAKEAGIENIETHVSAAEELYPALGQFDAAICRMGLMLFPAPSKALKALRELLNPGARFAALVFTSPAHSPFLSQPMAILLRHAGKPLPESGSPGLFALGGNGVLENLMTDCGFDDLETQTVEAAVSLPNTEAAVSLLREAAGAYRAVVADLNEDAKNRAWTEVHECLMQFETGDGFEARLEALICSGRSPE